MSAPPTVRTSSRRSRPEGPVSSPARAPAPAGRLALPLAAALATALAACAGAPPPRPMTFAEAGLTDEVARPATAAQPTGESQAGGPGAAAAVAATPRPSTAPVIPPGLPLEVLPPVAVPGPEAIPSEPPEGPPFDPVLLRFGVEARGRRLQARPGRGFPAEATSAWYALVAELDGYLLRPLPQTPILELVRAQVTVEAELAYDQRRYGQPPEGLEAAVTRRTSRLSARILAARTMGQSMFVARPPGKLRWPIERAGLSSVYGMRLHPLTGQRHWHAGVDLATERGRLVNAAGPGYVVRAGWSGGYGLLVELRHPGDLTTRYGHLSAVLCTPGDQLAAGQALGAVGETGLSTGPHLHFEVWRGGRPSDPLEWLGGGSMLATPATPAASAAPAASGGPR